MSGSDMFQSAVASQYDRHVGRYNSDLARKLISVAGVQAGQSVLDVGCGPGALSVELVNVVGADHVHAVDPSPAFVEAFQARLPGVDIQTAAAEDLPFPDRTFDAALAQLVVNFMSDATRGVGEMQRVTRPDGAVAAAVWDYGAGMTFLRRFWDAAVALDPTAARLDEALMRYASIDELRELWTAAGLDRVEAESAVVSADYADFDDLWSPLEQGVGPSGVYVRSLAADRCHELKNELWGRLGVGTGPFTLPARAWIVTGAVP